MATTVLSDADKDYIALRVVEYLLISSAGAKNQNASKKQETEDRKKKEEEDKKKDKKEDKEKEGGIKALVKKIVTILAPAALIASVIGSEASGLRVFLGSVKVLGNMIGAILTPGIIFASAMILTLSDMIGEVLLPNLENWYTAIISGGMDWLVKLDKGVSDLVNTFITEINDFVKAMINAKKTMGLFSAVLGMLMQQMGMEKEGKAMYNSGVELYVQGLQQEKNPEFKKMERLGLQKVWEAFLGPNVELDENGRPISKMQNFSSRMLGNLQKATQEFRRGFTPQSQSMGIAEAARNAQMAAFNMSPFERDNLKLLDRIATTLEKVNSNLVKPAVVE